MARFTVPPLTRVLLLLLIVFSSLAAITRYYTYILLMAEATRKEMGQGAGDIAPDPKNSIQVPQPSGVFVPYLTIVPGLSTTYPWVLFTASFVESNLLSFLFTGSTILYSGRYCEHIWGVAELARFVGLQTLGSNILTVLFYLLAFSARRGVDPDTGDSMTPVTISGGVALITGFLVAFKQMVPEHTVILFRGLIKIRVARLPTIFLGFYTLLCIFFLNDMLLVQAWTGFFISWVYLRFYRISYVDPLLPFSTTAPQKLGSLAGTGTATNLAFASQSAKTSTVGAQAGIKVKGDTSDSFALAQFFPEPLATAVSLASDRVFNALVVLRICTPFDPMEVEVSNMRAANRASGGSYVMSNSNYYSLRPFDSHPAGQTGDNYHPQRGSAREEAERRRALALKALGIQTPKPAALEAASSGQPVPSVPPPDLQLPNRAVLPPARVP